MQFIKIETPSEVSNKELRGLIARAQSKISSEYVLLINGLESGFISYENWSDKSLGFIYEIFVLPCFRGKGLGSKLLLYAEELANKSGATRLELKVNAFDGTISRGQLVSWYIRNGYGLKIEEPEKLEKIIVKRKATQKYSTKKQLKGCR